ncbi:MAG: AAA family ATPase, partial [Chlorobium sp.]|nr:AAA family ATPase [Chlorobium sp.]
SEKINKFLPPKSSRAYLQEILKNLANIEPSSKTNTAASLNEAAEKIKRRGIVVIISDFFDDINSVLKALKHFSYKKNEVIVFQVLDPLEKTFSFGKDAIFKDLETGDEITTQPYQIQKAYREAMKEFTNKIKAECLNSNIDYNLIETSDQYDKALLRYIQKREKLY